LPAVTRMPTISIVGIGCAPFEDVQCALRHHLVQQVQTYPRSRITTASAPPRLEVTPAVAALPSAPLPRRAGDNAKLGRS
jgi:hypothetical protein